MLKMPRNPSGQIYKHIKDLFMENFKKFMVRNRHLVALTVGVSVILIVFFSTLAIVLLDKPKPKDNSSNYTMLNQKKELLPPKENPLILIVPLLIQKVLLTLPPKLLPRSGKLFPQTSYLILLW